MLILSDSHGDYADMIDAAQREKPDEIIHLGDCWRDAERLGWACPDIPLYMVPGNCDDCWGKNDRLLLERQGWKILLAHGHQWHVKSGMGYALSAARECGAHILLFGHTHRALCRREEGLWVMNPGTVGGKFAPATYGVLEITPEGITPEIRPVQAERPGLQFER